MIQFKLIVTSNHPMEAWDVADQLYTSLDRNVQEATPGGVLETDQLPVHIRINAGDHTTGELMITQQKQRHGPPPHKFQLGEHVRRAADGQECIIIGMNYFKPCRTWLYTIQRITVDGYVTEEGEYGYVTEEGEWYLINQAKWKQIVDNALQLGYDWNEQKACFVKGRQRFKLADLPTQFQAHQLNELPPF